jgi:asparagine synthase (glutamine-hydrolysing)
MYAFVIYNKTSNTFFAARDHIGIKPLYYAKYNGNYYFASEQKCILPFAENIETFMPGFYSDNGIEKQYFHLSKDPIEMDENTMITTFKKLFYDAVKKRVDTDLPIAILFSGGLDSGAVIHVAKKYNKNITAFTIGFKDSSDVKVAKKYCKEFNIPHYIYELKEEELINIIPEVIYKSEFFESIDIMDTCIGYFSYKEVKRRGFKVALCGEGSDELLAGYDLFQEFDNKSELMDYRVHNLHRTDVQRVDRSSMMNSVEARVPFLDKEFLSFAYRIPMHMKLKNGISKWILREIFKDDLPGYIVNRKKIRMPDGSGLKTFLFDYANKQVILSDDIVKKLNIDSNQSAFFLKNYLDLGFPIPKERHKKPLFDYNNHGYFNFT